VAGRAAPDPAVRSAGVSRRQRPYVGSDRQARGVVLRAVAAGATRPDEFRADIVESLVRDGLVVERGGRLALP
jgi:A/G-specific adenine glycosylase